MKNSRQRRKEKRKIKRLNTGNGNGKIFIQIASYRDPLLESTVKSAIDQADHPENLVFSICRQFHPDDKFDTLNEWRQDSRFRIIDVDWEKAQGVCWARWSVQQQYKDEEYTLQIDSHHRFVKGWDTICIDMLRGLQKDGFPKPLITGYIPSFDPDNDPKGRAKEPWEMTFDRFIPEGAVFFLPRAIPNWKERTKPVRARFYSAHFAFTLGQFSVEVQHDPEYYFHGEEISIAVRAFTHGYDLFYPHKIIAWHEYTRKGRSKHWDDSKGWGKRNKECHQRNRALFGMDGEAPRPDDKYGWGKERTLKDYEKYAGLHFGKRAIQAWTEEHKEPPNPEVYDSEEEWEASFLRIFKHCIDVGYKKVPLDDYDFWCVVYKDKDGKELHRQDAGPQEIKRMKNDPDGYCKVWRKFLADEHNPPMKYVVWPHSKSKGWQEQIKGTLRNTAVVS